MCSSLNFYDIITECNTEGNIYNKKNNSNHTNVPERCFKQNNYIVTFVSTAHNFTERYLDLNFKKYYFSLH